MVRMIMKKFFRIAAAMATFAVVLASCNSVEPIVGTQDAPGIFINKSAATIIKGTSEKLVVTVTPKTDVSFKWTTSDPEVATVDANGVVSAVAAGNAEITATCTAGTVKCAVFVASPVTEVNLSVDGMVLDEDAEGDLTFTVGPEDHNVPFTPVWVSTDKSVCTVAADPENPAKAIVTPTGAGYASIILTVGDVNASCDVKVNKDFDKVYYMDKFRLGIGDRPSLEPQNWTSSNEKIAKVDAFGNVEIVFVGDVTISVEDNGQKVDFPFTAKINPAYQIFTDSQKTSAYNTAKTRALSTSYGQYYSCPIYYQPNGAVSGNWYQKSSYYTYFHEKTGNHYKFGAHYKSGSNDRRMEFEFDGEIVEGACYPASVYTLYHNDWWHSEVIDATKTNVEIYKIEEGKVMVLVNFFETFTEVMRQAYFMDTLPE